MAKDTIHKSTTILDRLSALWALLTISDSDFNAYMSSYNNLFSASPENTKKDYESGVPLKGYSQGSSSQLQELYKVMHLLCTLGSVEKMYMPPEIDSKQSVIQNQILFEQIVANDLKLNSGDKVLELGCGCGAIAEHIASLTAAIPYGMNLDGSQIEKSWKNPNLSVPNFIVGDFNKPLEFADNFFDAVYAIQPLTYISDHDFTFKEVFRVLKPGGMFVFNDVAALDAYDSENEHQKTLIQHTRELTVFGGFWYYKYWEDSLRKAGFTLISSTGRPAVEMIKKEVSLFDKYEAVFRFLSRAHLIPKKTNALMQRMNENSQSYIQAEEEELLTLNWHCVGQKAE
ncbi:MAG TPA: methyltransferase domain-containing protein [Acidimicrobiales bacterium]|nr:methyltransferase domain-containing protein [Acidimicrobiales bacterium]